MSNVTIDETNDGITISETSVNVSVTDTLVTSLPSLTDVTISSPADGESLAYNSSTGMWENSSTGSGDMIKSIYDTNDDGTVDSADVASSLIGAQASAIIANTAKVSFNWDYDYNDLINTPTIPTNNNELTNGAGYITSYAETDPVFTASQAANIASSDITNLNNLSGTNTGDQDLSSYVTKTGTPINNQLAIWTTDGVIEGDADVTYDGTTFGVIGNYKISDASTATKGYRYRTSGGALDFDFAGASMYFSGYPNADFTGTQQNIMRMNSGSQYVEALGRWHWRDATSYTGNTVFDIQTSSITMGVPLTINDNIVVTGTVDGRDISNDGDTLDALDNRKGKTLVVSSTSGKGDYGAYDETGIQAAIDELEAGDGGKIILTGHFYLQNDLEIAGDVPIILEGESQVGSTITCQAGSQIIIGNTTSTTESNIAMTDLYINITSATTNNAVNIINHVNFSAYNCRFRFAYDGVSIYSQGAGNKCYNIFFTNCRFEHNTNSGVNIYNVDGGTSNWLNYVTFTSCFFLTNGTQVIIDGGSTTGETSHHKFLGCYFDCDNTKDLLSGTKMTYTSFVGCTFDGDSGTTQITLDSASDRNSFLGCSFDTIISDAGDNIYIKTNDGDITTSGDITAGTLTGTLDVSNLNTTGTASSTTYLRGDNTWSTVSGGGAPEGTAVLSTGETGAVKFLREDGDGTCSWQVPSGSGDVSKVGTPVNNQVGVWTGDGTIEGTAGLAFDSATNNLYSSGSFSVGTTDTTRTFNLYTGSVVVADFSGGSASGLLMDINGASGTGYLGFRFLEDDVTKGFAGYYPGTGNIVIANSQGGAERISIDSSGYVGINNNNPTVELDVTGNALVSGNVTSSGKFTLASTYNCTVMQEVSGALMDFGVNFNQAGGADTGHAGALVRIDTRGGAYSDDLYSFIYQATPGSGETVVCKIGDNGDIVTNGDLTVFGSYVYGDTTNEYIRLKNGTGSGMFYGTTEVSCGSGTVLLKSSGSEKLRVDSDGVDVTGDLIVTGNLQAEGVYTVATLAQLQAILASTTAEIKKIYLSQDITLTSNTTFNLYGENWINGFVNAADYQITTAAVSGFGQIYFTDLVSWNDDNTLTHTIGANTLIAFSNFTGDFAGTPSSHTFSVAGGAYAFYEKDSYGMTALTGLTHNKWEFINSLTFTGSDEKVVTGTAGTNGQYATWNADGDIVGTTFPTRLSDVVDDTSPQLGGALDINGKSLTEELTAGESVVAGDICYLKSDGKFWKADASADTTSKGMIAMATESISADATGTFMLYGTYTTTGLTAGGEYYISETAGAKTTTAPTTSSAIVRIVGYAISTTRFFFNPDNSYVEVA